MGKPVALDFGSLVAAIQQVHQNCFAEAGRAVNLALTFRNWVIGCYIREYEQRGTDRARYGEDLLDQVAGRLQRLGLRRMSARELRRYRKFYLTYPQVCEPLIADLKHLIPEPGPPIRKIRESATPKSAGAGAHLAKSLSFTHLNELMAITDPLKRAFYEVECVGGHWSVRELKRQIGSLYFERSGLSRDRQKLASPLEGKNDVSDPGLTVRDPYVFEFLGLRSRDVMGESDLEDALLDKLQDFLLELGHGFCFEARQKRIQIGETFGFVDLVFFHRILKCHVLVELKAAEFSHEQMGQLNTYVSWYKRNMMTAGDNPPVGILLCTRKDHALVEYALADMDNRLFVSKYELKLPTRDEIRRFVESSLDRL